MRQDFLQDKKLTVEHKRAEAVLANLMPSHILQILLSKTKPPESAAAPAAVRTEGPEITSIAKKEDSVSVLFCDIMDFSKLSAEVSVCLRQCTCECAPA